jgi:diaminopimelate decarboxylase
MFTMKETTMETGLSRKRLLKLTEKYGTPLYVYDTDLILKRYEELYEFIKWPKLKIFYAMKANYNFHLLQLLNSVHAYIDAVSLGDVLLAMKAGFEKEDILYTANNVTIDEVKRIEELGIMQNIESLSALEKYGEAFEGGRLCLRFNTDIVAGEHAFVATGGEKSKFGILIHDLSKVKKIVDTYGLKVVGLHEHIGSGIADTEKVFESIKVLLSLATKENFPHLRFIDFGGGFKVPYEPGEKRIDYKAVGEKMTQIFREFCSAYGRELELYFEPGKYIVAESGYLMVQVNTIKQNRNHLIAGTNSGFSQLIRPVFYDAYHHIVNVSNEGGRIKSYDIYGNICESGDFFARNREMEEIREGDILAIMNAGAYCYSMGSVYNLRPMPPEVLVTEKDDRLSHRGLSVDEFIDHLASEYSPW